jgi:hypothetical protein
MLKCPSMTDERPTASVLRGGQFPRLLLLGVEIATGSAGVPGEQV